MCSLLSRGSLFFCTVNVNIAAMAAIEARGKLGNGQQVSQVIYRASCRAREGVRHTRQPSYDKNAVLMQLGGEGGGFRSVETNVLFWLFLPRILCGTENGTIGSVCTVTMWFVPFVRDSAHVDKADAVCTN